MNQNRRGYKAAARHFKKTEANLRKLCGARERARASGRRNTEADESSDEEKDWASLESSEFYTKAINHLAVAATTEKGIAASQSMRLMLDARKALDAGRPTSEPELSEEEVAMQLEVDMLDWPDQFLELALRVFGERHHGRILLVTEKHRAELVEGAWVTAAR